MRFIAAGIFLLNVIVTGLPAEAAASSGSFIAMELPVPGQMAALSTPVDPARIEGIRVYSQDPFRFDFLVNKGQGGVDVRQESERLIRYFLAALTVSEKDLWVNLSPYEERRIIPEKLGQTELGRDLLSEDYLLKQVSSSLVYPDGETGRIFWQKVYSLAVEKFGADVMDIPIDALNKVWIVPAKAVVYEDLKTSTAYVLESRLKVMLGSDHRPLGGNVSADRSQELSEQVIREVIIPFLEQEVNEGVQFSRLRQAYSSLILAAWFKRKIREGLLASVYVDKDKVLGIETGEPAASERIYKRYLDAFHQGVFNLVREEPSFDGKGVVPRKYFSGGMDMAMGSVIRFTGALDPLMVKSFREKFSLQRKDQFVVVTAGIDPAMSDMSYAGKAVPIEQALDLKTIVQELEREGRKSLYFGNLRKKNTFYLNGKRGPVLFEVEVSMKSQTLYDVNVFFKSLDASGSEEFYLFLRVDYIVGTNSSIQVKYVKFFDPLFRNNGFLKEIAAYLFKSDRVIIPNVTNKETKRTFEMFPGLMAHSQLRMSLLGRTFPDGVLVTLLRSLGDKIEFTLYNIDRYQGVSDLLSRSVEAEMAYWPTPEQEKIDINKQAALKAEYPAQVIAGLAIKIEEKMIEIRDLKDNNQDVYKILETLQLQSDRLRVIAGQAEGIREGGVRDKAMVSIPDRVNFLYKDVNFKTLLYPEEVSSLIENSISFVDHPVLNLDGVKVEGLFARGVLDKTPGILQGIAVFRQSEFSYSVGKNDVRAYLQFFRVENTDILKRVLLARVLSELLQVRSNAKRWQYLVAVDPNSLDAVDFFSSAGFVPLVKKFEGEAEERNYYVITVQRAEEYINQVLKSAWVSDDAQRANTGGVDMRDEQMGLEVRSASSLSNEGMPVDQDLSDYMNVEGFSLRIIDLKPLSSFLLATP